MKNKLFPLGLLLLLVLPSVILATEVSSPADKTKTKADWTFMPIFFSKPETGFGTGGMAIHCHQPFPEIENHQPDVFQLMANYTVNAQGKAMFMLNKSMGQNNRVIAEISYSHFPGNFYGIGSNTLVQNEENYTQNETLFAGSFLHQIFKNIYFGLGLRFIDNEVKDKKTGGILAAKNILGSEGIKVLGLELQGMWDTRDSMFYPYKGWLLELKTTLYSKTIGSESNFYSFDINYRRFHEIFKQNIIAWQIMFTATGGDVPFQLMPHLGGPHVMRGFYQGRFIDKHYLALQTEYRFPIYWRFKGDIFTGLGQVASEMREISAAKFKIAYGAGLRFALNEERNINLRADIALNSYQDEINFMFYVIINEAF